MENCIMYNIINMLLYVYATLYEVFSPITLKLAYSTNHFHQRLQISFMAAFKDQDFDQIPVLTGFLFLFLFVNFLCFDSLLPISF